LPYFITKSNFIRITQEVKLQEEKVNEEIYKKKIYFFNKIDESKILSVKQFLINAEGGVFNFVATGFIHDSYSFINEGAHHAKYHLDRNCKGLTSTYKDFEIPIEIKYKQGEQEIDVERVTEFRKWFNLPEIQDLFLNDLKKFIIRLQVNFNLINPPTSIELKSKGVQGISTLTEKELETEIDKLINSASAYYNASPMNREILVEHGFSKKTYWVTSKRYRSMPIEKNDTSYSDQEIRTILLEFYNLIKKPIINLLIDYWIIKLNPRLDFNKNILDQLDFKSCNLCANTQNFEDLKLDIDDSDES